MSSTPPTDRELEALKVLWERGEATVRDLADAMNAGAKQDGDDELAYTTVLSLLQVMEQKGLVGHRASGKVYSYFAKARREPTIRALARGFLDVSPRNRAGRSRNLDQMENGCFRCLLGRVNPSVWESGTEANVVPVESLTVCVKNPSGFLGNGRERLESDFKTNTRRIAR